MISTQNALGRLDHLSFKGNLKQTRYGWLRLTPAYSVHLVGEILDTHATKNGHVLDPFCGTGTTALVCAERGIRCDTTDINPFLLWLTATKTRAYAASDIDAFKRAAVLVEQSIHTGGGAWAPVLHQIEKWWDEPTLGALSHVMATIQSQQNTLPISAIDLLKVAFCRTMIECANVSFGHQSMSFKKPTNDNEGSLTLWPDSGNTVADTWRHSVALIHKAAYSPITKPPRPLFCDARTPTTALAANTYTCVVTSPPYPNRMSYIRELRPYMYWLGFLGDGRAAGEMDWQAIGGTWGCATSNVSKWKPPTSLEIPYVGFGDILRKIATQGTKHSPLLSRYVHRYFYDMTTHCAGLFDVVAPGGTIHYVVGNSKFYDVMVPVEKIFSSLFEAAGFQETSIRVIRKRTSKKELFEFVVSAIKPALREQVA